MPVIDVIDVNLICNYFIVAGSVGVMYDWGLTFGNERQRWSLMTLLYLSMRYGGIGYVVSLIMYNALEWIAEVVEVILGVIMIARLHAMYQQSRKVLIYLIVIFLAINIANIVMIAIMVVHISGGGFILSGTYQCIFRSTGDAVFLSSMIWVLITVWEVLVLCLAVWITVKHFRELRQHSTSGIMSDCFTVLIKTHASYFTLFLALSCFRIGLISPTLSVDISSLDSEIYIGPSQIFQLVHMFVLGPRLILGIREYYAELVVNSDTATAMTSIAFQERIHVSTSSSV
ncbi:hypothetical protein BDR07DRAFT_1406553 [Suillus spraguei]|nr:hypothetical protein BDR07DRAFT_1406553 [Suillus spraguei]